MNQNENTHKSTLEEMNEYLEHHGVKGQKWGIRRTPEQLGHKVASGTKKAASAAGEAIGNQYKKAKAKAAVKKAVKQKAKAAKKAHDAQVKRDRDFTSVKNLTNQELNDRINRLRAEATYKQLLNSDSNIKKGKNIYTQAFSKGSSKAIEKGAQALGGMLVNRLLANENNLNPTGFYKEDKSRFNLNPTSNNSDRNRPDFDKQQEHKAKSGATYNKTTRTKSSTFKDAVDIGKEVFKAYNNYSENKRKNKPIDVDFTVEEINQPAALPAPKKKKKK